MHVLRLLLVVLSLGVLAALPADAAKKQPMGLATSATSCTGKAEYGYRIAFRGAPKATYLVFTGNTCTQNGVCRGNTGNCTATCNAAGSCSAELRGCTIGRGTPWVRVATADRAFYDEATPPPPASRCL